MNKRSEEEMKEAIFVKQFFGEDVEDLSYGQSKTGYNPNKKFGKKKNMTRLITANYIDFLQSLVENSIDKFNYDNVDISEESGVSVIPGSVLDIRLRLLDEAEELILQAMEKTLDALSLK